MKSFFSFFTALPKSSYVVFFIGLFGILIGIVGITLSNDPSSFIFYDSFHWTVSLLSAAILSWQGYKRNRSSTLSQTGLWFLIGFVGYAIGQLAWDVQIYYSYSLFPSPSDFFYLWFGLSVSIALFYEIYLHHDKETRNIFLFDFMIVFIAVLTLILIAYLPKGGGVDTLSMIVLVSYPITMIMPVIMVLLMVLSFRLYLDIGMMLFLIGLSVTAASWMYWNYMALQGILEYGTVFNMSFSIAILLVGLAVSNWQFLYLNNHLFNRFNYVFIRIIPVVAVILSSMAIILVGLHNDTSLLTKYLVYFGAAIVMVLSVIRQSNMLYDRELAQIETLDRLSLATVHNEIGIWDWNLQTMEMVWDDSMFALYHMRREDFSGAIDAWEKSLHPDDKERCEEKMRMALAGEATFDAEFRVIWTNGEVHHIKAIAKTFFDDNGKPIRMLGTNIDITKLREAEEELIKKDKILITHSRQAAMGEMISMIAHQWRQPLSVISTTIINLQTKVVLDENLLADQEKSYFLDQMNTMNTCVQNLSTTINDFRDFYKPNKKSEVTTLEEVCKKSLAIIKTSLVANNVNIIEEYHSDIKLDIFTNEMLQVVLNIIKNAQDNFIIKNIPKPYIKISTVNKELRICDNGGGIPEHIIEHIFEPYYSTKNEMNGTGLGLYMSKTIVEEHHKAKLYAENTADGVCFIIVFK